MMTLSSGGEWALHAPPLATPPSGRARPKSGTPAPEAPNPQKRPLFLRSRPPFGEREIEVKRGPARLLEEYREGAAQPRAAVEEQPEALVLTLDAPGASPRNTDVVWDSDERKLVVGVWASRRPHRPRGVPPPELAYFRSHWLPHCAGAAARATIANGRLRIVVPWLSPRPSPVNAG